MIIVDCIDAIAIRVAVVALSIHIASSIRAWIRSRSVINIATIIVIIIIRSICHHHVLWWRIIIRIGSRGMISNVTVSKYRRHIHCRIRELSIDAVTSFNLSLSSIIIVSTTDIAIIICITLDVIAIDGVRTNWIAIVVVAG